MATQNEDGSWKSMDGSTHNAEWEAQGADNRFRALQRDAASSQRASQGIAKLIPLLVGIGVIAAVVLFLIMVVKNTLTLISGQWPYILVIVLALAALIAVRILLKGRKFRGLAAFAAMVAAGFLGWQAVSAVYNIGSFHFPSAYSADYIMALPGGTAPSLYEKRGQNGKVLAELSVDERVTVNGVTSNEKEFNVTTAAGLTGWVPSAAFPKGAQERPYARRNSGGEVTEPIYVDRLVERLASRYLVEQKGYPNRYQITRKTLDASVVVQAEAPISYLDGAELRNSKSGDTVALTETGDNVELHSVMYADDCTMIWLMAAREHDLLGWDISGAGNTAAWHTSLTAKDLESGESWQVLPMKRSYTYMDAKYEGKQQSAVIYFFPPFKSRHFSLTHNGVSALPDKSKAGHGGILGLFSKIAGGGIGSNYIDWNFSEVRVR